MTTPSSPNPASTNPPAPKPKPESCGCTPEKNENTLQGSRWEMNDPAKARDAIEQAFDYRGDVTITLTDGSSVEGYLYDRRTHPGEPLVRLMPKDGSARRTILVSNIREIVFTGRDTASGKSWETWMRKWAEKKAKGEAANLEPENLE